MKNKRQRYKPKAIDLFAGAGLFSSAFIREGFQIIRAIEIDPVAASTYKNNLGDHIENADITLCKPSGRCDVLVGGPPCQGFSTLGKRDGNDKRNLLSYEVLKWAVITKPKIIIIENVSAFLSSDIWMDLSEKFSEIGYEVNASVLNAYDFGVPQVRKRSFTIATKIGFPKITPVLDIPVRTVKEAWAGLPSVPNNKSQHVAPKPSQLALARMRLISKGGNKTDIMRSAPELVPNSWWSVADELTDVWGRMEWDRPCNTLRTCFQNPSKGRYIHPDQDRVISLREGARLHTIEDSWTFSGLPTQITRQIGNSVPLNLGRAVARGVRELF